MALPQIRRFYGKHHSVLKKQQQFHARLLQIASLIFLLNVTVLALEPPIAYSESLTVNEDLGGYIIYTLRGSDADTDETLSYVLTRRPAKLDLYQYNLLSNWNWNAERIDASRPERSLVKDAGARILIFAKNQPRNLNGLDNFTFIVEDSRFFVSNEAQVNITITPVPDPPNLPSGWLAVHQEDTPQWMSLCYNNKCFDEDNPTVRYNFTLIGLPQLGAFYDIIQNELVEITALPYAVLSPNSSILFVPKPGINGTSYLYMNVSTFAVSVPVRITIGLRGVNDPPVAENVYVFTNEDDPTVITPNCSDIDSNNLTYRLISFPVRHRFFQFSNNQNDTFGSDIINYVDDPQGRFWLVPEKDFFGQILLIYECNDNDRFNGKSSRANITITVHPVNDAPEATCSRTVILGLNFLSGNYEFASLPIFAEDRDEDILFVKVLDPPQRGFLADGNGTELKSGDRTSINSLRFYHNSSGGGYPYGNFSYIVTDPRGATTEKCVITFETPCAPLYMNIFSNGTGSICEPCPLGANCSVIGDCDPIAADGYWKVPGRNDLYLTCDPPSSCSVLSGETCRVGYRGIRCGECDYGYYRRNQHCLKCNGDNFGQSVALTVAFVFAIILIIRAVLSLKNHSSIGIFYIILGFIQSLTVIGEININWPTLLKDFLQILAVSNMKEESIMPECLFGGILHDWSSHKMWIAWLLPLLLCATSMLVTVVEALGLKWLKWWRLRNSYKNCVAIVPNNVHLAPLASYFRVIHVVLYISYLNFIKSSVNIFDCTAGLDGYAYLDADPSFRCYTEEWQRRVPLAIAGLCLFVIGIPLYFMSLLYFKYHPKVDKTVKSWSTELLTFGHSYKQEAYYFIVIQLIMKTVLVCSNAFLSGRPALQVVSAYAIFEIDFILHLYLRPYVSNELNIFHAVSNCCAMLVLLLGLFHDQTSFAEWMSSESKGLAVGLVLVIIVVIYILAVACWLVYYFVARRFKLMNKSVVRPQPLQSSQSISSP